MIPQAYRFERIFHPDADGRDQAVEQPEMTSDMIEEIIAARVDAAVETAREQNYSSAYAAGYQDGRSWTRQEQEETKARDEAVLADRIGALSSSLREAEARIARDGVAAVATIVRHLVPELLAANSQLKAEALLAAEMGRLRRDGGLTVLVAPDQVEHWQRAVRFLLQQGAETPAEVRADPTLSGGAIDIRWKDGGLHYDPAAIAVDVQHVVEGILREVSSDGSQTGRGRDAD